MNDYQSAFRDAMLLVGTANTPTYLRNRLISHPLVTYLKEAFSTQELAKKLSSETKTFDNSIEKLTIIYLLVAATITKVEASKVDLEILSQLTKKRIPWLKEIIGLLSPASKSITNTVAIHKYKPAIAGVSSKQNIDNSFIALAWEK